MQAWLALGLLLGAAQQPEPRLGAVFGDGAVLQRDVPVVLWGQAPAGTEVAARFLDRPEVARVCADADGRWRLALPARAATPLAGRPAVLRVDLGERETVRRVWIGDVWLCAGQSNMELPLRRLVGGERALERAAEPGLHLFRVARRAAPERAADVSGSWAPSSRASAADFSGLAWLVGAALRDRHGVHVGLLQATWSGSPGRAWTPLAALGEEPRLRDALDQRRALLDAGRAPGPHTAGALWDGMVAPLAGLPLRGVLWYQGEADAERAGAYGVLFPRLIRAWRAAWGAELPFLWVQLPAYRPVAPRPADSAWAELREAQARALELPRTGQAVAIDTGAADDVHPADKRELAARLVLLARAVAHGEAVDAVGPRFDGVAFDAERGTARVRFVEAAGLRSRTGRPPRGFTLAGADRVFHPAQAALEGGAVVLRSLRVPAPVAVRYAWADNPGPLDLVDGGGLPAEPFRSDTWPGTEARPPASLERRRARAEDGRN